MWREQLRRRSAVLREQVVAQSAVLQPALTLADQVRGGMRWVRAHPGVVAAAVATLVVLRPRRALAWGLRAWSAWRLLGRVRAALQGMPRVF